MTSCVVFGKLYHIKMKESKISDREDTAEYGKIFRAFLHSMAMYALRWRVLVLFVETIFQNCYIFF